MTPNPDIEKILEEFDGRFVIEKYSGSDGFLAVTGPYEVIRDFLRQSLLSYGKAQREEAYKEIIEAIPDRAELYYTNPDIPTLIVTGEGFKHQLRDRFLKD